MADVDPHSIAAACIALLTLAGLTAVGWGRCWEAWTYQPEEGA